MDKSIPIVMGFPVWENLKRRVAKKWLNERSHRFRKNPGHYSLRDPYWGQFRNIKVGSLIHDCSGMNGRILELAPHYIPYGKDGAILIDVDITTTNGGCSLIHCGVQLPLSREEIEQNRCSFIRDWMLGAPGKRWYGGTGDDWINRITDPVVKARLDQAQEQLKILDQGGHICDPDGCLDPKWSFSV